MVPETGAWGARPPLTRLSTSIVFVTSAVLVANFTCDVTTAPVRPGLTTLNGARQPFGSEGRSSSLTRFQPSPTSGLQDASEGWVAQMFSGGSRMNAFLRAARAARPV